MSEEEKIKAGILFNPADPELKAIKLKTHNLNVEYNHTHEDETEKRAAILSVTSVNSEKAALYKALSLFIMASTPKLAKSSNPVGVEPIRVLLFLCRNRILSPVLVIDLAVDAAG